MFPFGMKLLTPDNSNCQSLGVSICVFYQYVLNVFKSFDFSKRFCAKREKEENYGQQRNVNNGRKIKNRKNENGYEPCASLKPSTSDAILIVNTCRQSCEAQEYGADYSELVFYIF